MRPNSEQTRPFRRQTITMRYIQISALCVVVALVLPSGEAQATKQFVGTVSAFKPDTAEIEIKPDNAPAVLVRTLAATVASRIAPGAKDLKNADTIKITDVAIGDRVLVALEPGTSDLRRIVVMAAVDIAKHDDADKLDWAKRGVSGVVTAKIGNEVTLKIRTLTGESKAVVTVSDQTAYRRYAPDSVKFADARKSSLADVSLGDQFRARGQKSEDGQSVAAAEVVFGTFQTKAGSIVSVDTAANTVTIKEMGTGNPLTVKVLPDSQVKKMPDLSAMMGAGIPGTARTNGTPSPGGKPPAGPDLTQMLERMPSANLADLKPGEMIVVSSTKGAKPDEVTAIMLLGNANMLIQMASAQGAGGRGGGASAALSGMMSGGFEMPSMMQ